MYSKITESRKNDSELWKMVLQGNESALAALFHNYHQPLFNYGYKIIPRKDFVEDCVQVLFLKIWEKHEVISDARSVKVYLFISMRRIIFKKLRKMRNQVNRNIEYAEEMDDTSHNIEDFIIINEQQNEYQKKLRNALDALSKRGQEVIYLKYYSGMSNSEIASLMDIKRQSVYNHVSEAIKRMQHTVT